MMENYKKEESGAIRQVEVRPYVYDQKYVEERYDSYGAQCDMMSFLRYGYLVGTIRRRPQSVLDVGYGNGSFLKICQQANVQTFGTDVSGYPLKYGASLELADCLNRPFDVVTFFDSLEHFHDISFLGRLNCNYAYVSLPNCGYNEVLLERGESDADEYFKNWKHRRENEHIWHFDIKSLYKTMQRHGFKLEGYEYIEDVIRKPTDEHKNILSAVFGNIK